jgi:predicted transcriptional regulator
LLLGLLAAKLEASQAIAKVASDPAWLKKQHAADLAELVRTLDATALALGDRLAGSSTDPADSGDSG